MRPVATRRNIGFDVFNVRLLIALDKLLRKKRRYQGDLSASINDALLAHVQRGSTLDAVRRALREELAPYGKARTSRSSRVRK